MTSNFGQVRQGHSGTPLSALDETDGVEMKLFVPDPASSFIQVLRDMIVYGCR